MASVDAGESQMGVAKRYCVSRGMVIKLLRLRRETGSLAPRVQGPRPGYKIMPANRRKMAVLVRQQPDITLEELRVALNLTCTPQAIHYALKGMGLTFKKRPFALRKASDATCS
ncbi:MAG: IS630 transposase-related protein [Candidatus Methylacidiphilales bacterium]|nr:IS630 transposase-related protein [Candidatus Methylacidiphilales bacterium]